MPILSLKQAQLRRAKEDLREALEGPRMVREGLSDHPLISHPFCVYNYPITSGNFIGKVVFFLI